MTRDGRLTDDRIEAMLSRRSADPHPGLMRDILSTTAGMPQERRWGVGFVPPRVAVLLGAALLAAAVIGGSLATGAFRDRRDPTEPVPAPVVPGWMGAVRPDLATLPTILLPHERDGLFIGVDPPDAGDEDIDLTVIRTQRGRQWDLRIAGHPPPDATLEATGRVIEYGVVLDDGLDGVADCSIGLSSDAGEQTGYRVWVTNLVSGVTKEQIGPPYGYPIDFSHPNEQSDPPFGMRFFFLAGTVPCDLSTGRIGFYAWATTSTDGVVEAWDYAPDNAWFLPEVDR
jgi:hypothetical protein